MIYRFRSSWNTPAGRGFILLATMQLAFGFAYSANNSTVTNFFEEILHFTGPQFGYITAIRELGGLTLILSMALFYRISLQRLTAGALVVMGIGFALYGVAHDFFTLIPWILMGSFGMHIVLQTQLALGMNLTTQDRSGITLGRMNAFYQVGVFLALITVFVVFQLKLFSFIPTFIIIGVIATLGGLAILGFPHLQDGEARQVAPKREQIVWRKDYGYYYALSILDGVRQQIFFSFGLWVLVNRFEYTVPHISLLLMIITGVCIFSSSYIGWLMDRFSERRVLQAINLGYVVALIGYSFVGSAGLAGFFYVIYSFIQPFSTIGAASYLRKIAVPEEVSPSLAMGVTLQHVAAVIVPVGAGYILNFVGYRVPFLIAAGTSFIAVFFTHLLNPMKQRTAARVALDEARALRETSPAYE